MLNKLTAVVSATIVMTTPVFATRGTRSIDWHIINQRTQQCQLATDNRLTTPDDYRRSLIRNGYKSTISIARNDYQTVIYAIVSRRDAESRLLGESFWFPAWVNCEIARTNVGAWNDVQDIAMTITN